MSRIIEQSVHIDAPVDVVWRTVTEPDRVRLWFADTVDVQASPGHQGSMTFGTDPADATTVHVSVQAVDPPRSLAYRWQHPAGSTAGPGFRRWSSSRSRPRARAPACAWRSRASTELPWPEDRKSSFEADHTDGWATHLARLADAVHADTVPADTVPADTVTRREHARP